MNKNALTKVSKRKVVTQTGKLPDSFGAPAGKVQGGGFTRKLTKRESEQQKALQSTNTRF